MENGSPVQCPNTVTVRRNPHRRARPTPAAKAAESNPASTISSFPLQEILAMEVPQNPKHSSSSSLQTPLSENLKVYLRVRPLQLNNSKKSGNPGDQTSKPGHVWPQNPRKKKLAKEKIVKKKSSELCVTINDDHSVTVCPPVTLQETRRCKSEVYEGFSHVFSTESTQGGVYEKMVGPLVGDFLKGKSGMLTALGPSGSGKTHTIFGTPRDPGMVPLALQQIFRTDSSDSKFSRSYCLSIFEIYSEKGKGEKMYDLSADGGELTMQQFTIKGLKEVLISNAGEAESLVACAMTRRATAITNANSTSSRSQCIINIRRVANQDEVEDASNCAILTIADLAGAEREKRTGTQGTRLLEANFINNTSMVFGLCLRSLFEHQRNPKKPLQKHFQNSLLTKYLRDYLEGKKRMTLILTVKAGEEDYLDTSYLLRQASPYMKIKFNTVVEPSNTNKRQLQRLFTFEEQKRAKYSVPEACSNEGIGHGEEGLLPHGEPLGNTECPATKSSHTELAGSERNHLIMQNFAKAIWQVLKQYRDELKSAENENKKLREEIKEEKMKYFELEQRWENSRCSTCSKEDYVEAASIKVVSNFELKSSLEESRFNGVHETITNSFIKVKESDINNCLEPDEVEEACINHINETTPRNACNTVKKFAYVEADGGCLTENPTAFGTPQSHILVKQDSCSSVELDKLSEQDEESTSAESPLLEASFIHCNAHECGTQPVLDTPLINQSISEKSERDICALNGDKELLAQLLDSRHLPSTEDVAPCQEQEHNIDVHCSEPRADISSIPDKPKRRLFPVSSTLLRDFSNMHVEDNIKASKKSTSAESPLQEASFTHCIAHECGTQSVLDTPLINQSISEKSERDISALNEDKKLLVELLGSLHLPSSEDVASCHEQGHNIDVHCSEPRAVISNKLDKPKRRLLPASSTLLRDFSNMHVEDDIEASKVNRNGKKSAKGEKLRTQGNISLMRMLKGNLRF